MKTPLPNINEIDRKWYCVDASGQILGRLASKIAFRLRGKHKPCFAPHLDVGDFIVVVNAGKIKLTGKKLDNKMYYKHSGYLGHLKTTTARKMIEKKPEEVIIHAVRLMLPKNIIGRHQLKKLKVYVGPEHPHAAQMPAELKV